MSDDLRYPVGGLRMARGRIRWRSGKHLRDIAELPVKLGGRCGIGAVDRRGL